MPEPRIYPPGVTCWVDTEQPDVDAARRFYGELFGWTLTETAGADATGPYLIATADGQDAGAIGPQNRAAGEAGGSAGGSAGKAAWNTYVAVDSADATASAVITAGGSVTREPTDTGFGARIAACTDPAGAEFRLWQAHGRPGVQHVNTPGGWNFSDLHTSDRAAAMAFYTPLFGWKAVDLEQGAGTMLQVPGYGDHLAATSDPDIYERQASAPAGFADVIGGLSITAPGEPARWRVTFTVADRDAIAATAEKLGATILTSSDDMWTRNALVRDPQGAEFTVSQFTPPDDW